MYLASLLITYLRKTKVKYIIPPKVLKSIKCFTNLKFYFYVKLATKKNRNLFFENQNEIDI